MFKLYGFMILILATLTFSTQVVAATLEEDDLVMSQIERAYDNGEISETEALAQAIKQDLSFEVIVSFCQNNGIPLGKIVEVAQLVGMSGEVALAKLAGAGVSLQDLADSGGLGATGLGYTPAAPGVSFSTVRTVTSNPGGSAQGASVSPSAL